MSLQTARYTDARCVSWQQASVAAVSLRQHLFLVCQKLYFKTLIEHRNKQEVSGSQGNRQCATAARSQCLTPEPKVLVIAKVVDVVVIHLGLSSSAASQGQVAVWRDCLAQRQFCVRCVPCFLQVPCSQ